MWCWRRMEKISWTDHVRNEVVLLRVKEQRNILHEIRKRKAKWIGHILRRNCLLQRVTEGKIQVGIEVTGRQGRRRMKLLDGLKERRGYSHLKEDALDRPMWRARFWRGFGPVVRQTTKWMNTRNVSAHNFRHHQAISQNIKVKISRTKEEASPLPFLFLWYLLIMSEIICRNTLPIKEIKEC